MIPISINLEDVLKIITFYTKIMVSTIVIEYRVSPHIQFGQWITRPYTYVS